MKNNMLGKVKENFKTFSFKNSDNEHNLIVGDCIEVMKSFPENSIDLIVTDPPYNVGLNYGSYSNDRKKKNDYFAECKAWLKECAKLLKSTGSLYLISYPEINARLLPFIEDELKLKFRRWITWHYPTNIGHSKRNFTRSQRSILFFTKSNKYTFNRENIIQHYKNPEVKKIKERLKNGSLGRNSYDLLRLLDIAELSEGMIDVLDINLLKNVKNTHANSLYLFYESLLK